MILPREAKLQTTMHYVGWPLAALFAWDVLVTVSYVYFRSDWLELPSLPLPLLGSVLALFLTFRNTTAYARWWEARTLWGATINASRSVARQSLSLIDGGDPHAVALRQAIVLRQIAFAHGLRNHLRRLRHFEDLDRLLPAVEAAGLREIANVPNAILTGTAALAQEALHHGWTDSIRQTRLETTLLDLANAQGGMERIKNTPMPPQYTFFPVIFTQLFCVLLPVGLVDQLRIYTPLASTVVGFMLLAVLQIGDDLQDPFENTEFDVPMTAMSRTIEIDLLQSLGAGRGDIAVPEPLKPVRGVLW